MNTQDEKCVIILDERLPPGMIANTAAILGVTLGQQKPELVGMEVYDKTGPRPSGNHRVSHPRTAGRRGAHPGHQGEALQTGVFRPDSSGLLRPGSGLPDIWGVYRKDGGHARNGAALSGNCHLWRKEKGQSADRKSAAAAVKPQNWKFRRFQSRQPSGRGQRFHAGLCPCCNTFPVCRL